MKEREGEYKEGEKIYTINEIYELLAKTMNISISYLRKLLGDLVRDRFVKNNNPGKGKKAKYVKLKDPDFSKNIHIEDMRGEILDEIDHWKNYYESKKEELFLKERSKKNELSEI